MAKTYTAYSGAVAIGNGKSLLSIGNTHASRIVKVWRIWMYPNTSAVTGVMINVNVRRFTTQSAGSAVTPVAHNTANVSVDLTSITVSTGATITSPTIVQGFKIPSEEVIVSGASNQSLHALYPFALLWDAGVGDSNIQPLTARQNQGIDVVCATNSTAGNFDMIFEFTVE